MMEISHKRDTQRDKHARNFKIDLTGSDYKCHRDYISRIDKPSDDETEQMGLVEPRSHYYCRLGKTELKFPSDYEWVYREVAP